MSGTNTTIKFAFNAFAVSPSKDTTNVHHKAPVESYKAVVGVDQNGADITVAKARTDLQATLISIGSPLKVTTDVNAGSNVTFIFNNPIDARLAAAIDEKTGLFTAADISVQPHRASGGNGAHSGWNEFKEGQQLSILRSNLSPENKARALANVEMFGDMFHEGKLNGALDPFANAEQKLVDGQLLTNIFKGTIASNWSQNGNVVNTINGPSAQQQVVLDAYIQTKDERAMYDPEKKSGPQAEKVEAITKIFLAMEKVGVFDDPNVIAYLATKDGNKNTRMTPDQIGDLLARAAMESTSSKNQNEYVKKALHDIVGIIEVYGSSVGVVDPNGVPPRTEANPFVPFPNPPMVNEQDVVDFRAAHAASISDTSGFIIAPQDTHTPRDTQADLILLESDPETKDGLTEMAVVAIQPFSQVAANAPTASREQLIALGQHASEIVAYANGTVATLSVEAQAAMASVVGQGATQQDIVADANLQQKMKLATSAMIGTITDMFNDPLISRHFPETFGAMEEVLKNQILSNAQSLLVGIGGSTVGDVVEALNISYDAIKLGAQTGDWGPFLETAGNLAVSLVQSTAIITVATLGAAAVFGPVGATVAGVGFAIWGLYEAITNGAQLFEKIRADIVSAEGLVGFLNVFGFNPNLAFDITNGEVTIGTDANDGTFVDGEGHDTYVGKNGIETLSFDGQGYAVYVAAKGTEGSENPNESKAEEGFVHRTGLWGRDVRSGDVDWFHGVENFVLTDHNDVIYATEADNIITTQSGDDAIYGGGGRDTLFGGAGSDTIDGGSSTFITTDGIEREHADEVHYNQEQFPYLTLGVFDVQIGVTETIVKHTLVHLQTTDTLQNVEHVHFDNQEVLLHFTSAAHQHRLFTSGNGYGSIDFTEIPATFVGIWSPISLTLDYPLEPDGPNPEATVFQGFETWRAGSGTNDTLVITDPNATLSNRPTGTVFTLGPDESITVATSHGALVVEGVERFVLPALDATAPPAPLEPPESGVVPAGLVFEVEVDTDTGARTLDFSGHAGRVLWRSTQALESITHSPINDWMYSGIQATFQHGVNADGTAPTGPLFTHVIGTAQADALQGVVGQTLDAGAGTDHINIMGADRVTGGQGADVFRWIHTAERGTQATTAQVVEDFGADDTFVAGAMARNQISWGSTANGDATMTHNASGRTIVFTGQTATFVEERTVFESGGLWVGTHGNDLRDNTGSNSAWVHRGLGGHDRLIGGNRSDQILGEGGNDVLFGGDGDDTLWGGDGNDNLTGGNGRDVFHGEAGDDTLHATTDRDSAFGGEGNDYLLAAYDGGSLHGGEGSDFFLGTRGDGYAAVIAANLRGDAGRDVFMLPIAGIHRWFGGERQAHHTIWDFDPNEDFIFVQRDVSSDHAEVIGWYDYGTDLRQVGSDVHIGHNDNRVVKNITVAELQQSLILVGRTGANDGSLSSIILDARAEALAFWQMLATGGGVARREGTSAANTLNGNGGRDAIYGYDGSDLLNGRGGNDLLEGGNGDDTLDGGTGADSMVGGMGNDVYTVDDVGDTVVEEANGGNDTLRAAFTYTLGEQMEHLVLIGTGAIAGTGNAGANTMAGNAGDNALHGMDGNDTLTGGDGHDALSGGDGFDSLLGGNGDDLLDGGTGNDTLTGEAGHDTLDGGAGADMMVGGAGDDTYLIDHTGDTITEAQDNGIDTVHSTLDHTLASHLERLVLLGATPIRGTGNWHANTLTGNDGGNLLQGFGNNDTLFGGAGADTLDGGPGHDRLEGGDGNDSLTGGLLGAPIVHTPLYTEVTLASQTLVGTNGRPVFTVTTTSNENNLTTGSHGTLTGFRLGNGDSNETHTHAADVTLQGARVAFNGLDTTETITLRVDGVVWNLSNAIATGMVTFNGAGAYGINAAGQVVRVGSIASNPTTVGSITINTTLTSVSVVAAGTNTNATTSGFFYEFFANTNPLDSREEAGHDTLVGGTGQDTLVGGDGNDLLEGGVDGDSLSGGNGNDTLDGGEGADTMSGGTGDDTYAVDDPGDMVVETANQGTDTVRTSRTFVLADSLHVERVELLGSANLHATGNAMANTLVGNNGANRLDGGAGNDTLWGGDGANTLLGGDGNDLIIGGADHDTLDGGDGNDALRGGNGDDLYIVDGLDQIEEHALGGHDTVHASTSFSLSMHLETLVLLGGAAIDAWGNGADNSLVGNGSANRLEGDGGNDTLDGSAGNDILDGGEGHDLLFGGTGTDELDGGAGNDTLYSDGGDFLAGGTGDDLYLVEGDQTYLDETEGQGDDTIHASVDVWIHSGIAIEHIVLVDGSSAQMAGGNSLDNTLTGNSLDNQLWGEEGHDTLEGRDGHDTVYGGSGDDGVFGGAGHDVLVGEDGHDSLEGGDGDDVLVGDAGNDTLIGGAGQDSMEGGAGDDLFVTHDAFEWTAEGMDGGDDTLLSYADAFLGDHVEHLVLAGVATEGYGNDQNNTLTGTANANVLFGLMGNDTIWGGAGHDVLGGDEGDDLLDGGEGMDAMEGGDGDDAYVVDHALDSIWEDDAAGTDTVLAGASFSLEDAGEVEHLTLTHDAASGIGNTLANHLTGNTVANSLQGLGGADTLDGQAGDDTLEGGDHDDLLYGGSGADDLVGGAADDVLVGGEGADRFLFTAGTGADTIVDFLRMEGDTLVFQADAFAPGTTTADVLALFATVADGATTIAFQGGSVRLEGVTDLAVEDVVFA